MICDVARCKRSSMVGYAAFPNSAKEVSICEYHWGKHCDDEDKFDIRTHFYPSKVVATKSYFTKLGD